MLIFIIQRERKCVGGEKINIFKNEDYKKEKKKRQCIEIFNKVNSFILQSNLHFKKEYLTFFSHHLQRSLLNYRTKKRNALIPRWNLSRKKREHNLEGIEFCSSPVTSLGVVTDGVASAKTDPLGKRTVLFHLLGKNALDSEGLVGTHF